MTATRSSTGARPVRPRVADVVRRTPAVFPEASFKQVLRAMVDGRARAVPVMDATGRVVGIVSDADLLTRVLALRARRSGHHRDPGRHSVPLTAKGLMTSPVLTALPDESVEQAACRLAAAGVRQLVVVDRRGQLVGVVGRAELIADLDRDDRAILDDVVHEVLVKEFCVDPTGIDVAVHDGIVTLTGQVEHHELARLIGDAVADLPGVLDVDDRLTWPEPDRRRESLVPVPVRN